MAKWGEGDPRWIVEERTDGRNVNAWHWSEKNLSDWFKRTLLASIENKDVPGGEDAGLRTGDVSDYEGDCIVFNRKGKLAFMLDLKFKASWTASIGAKEVKGKAEVEDLDHDTKMDRAPVRITLDKDKAGGSAAKAKEAAGAALVPFIRLALQSAVHELLEGHGLSQEKAAGNAATQMAPKFGSLNYTIQWLCPTELIFRFLTDAARVSACTRTPATLEARVDGPFAFLNGAVTGHFTAIEENRQLSMKWRFESWPAGYYSTVDLRFVEGEGTCDMQLLHSGLIIQDVERAKVGWRENFWEPMQTLLGCGFVWKGGVH